MAMKRKITKAEYDKLSDEAKKNYKAGEFSDTYVIDLDGEDDSDDPAELRRALAREREDRKKAQKEARALREAAGETGDDDNADDDNADDNDPPARRGSKRAQADAKKIDADWKKKYDKDTGGLAAKLSTKDAFIKRTLINDTAERIARTISTAPTLMAKAIAERLDVDFDGDEPELIIKGADGKPAAITLEKLEKEFRDNKEYSSIIIGSKSSGGGAPKAGTETKTGGGAPASDDKTDLSKMSGKSLAETLKARKEANAN